MVKSREDANVQQNRLVAVITYNGLCTFEFGLAVEVFGLARPEFDFPWYRFAVAAAEDRKVRAIGSISVETDGGLELLDTAGTIVIPGWRDKTEQPPKPLLDALIKAHERGARLMSICSGVFVLAAAGLLSGRSATTHWRHVPYLKERYPDIRVEEDVLYVDEGPLITSAGSAAGIDAALHLVRRDYGAEIANKVACRLVMAPHRDGGQAQFAMAPIREPLGPTMSEVMAWARARIDQPIGLAQFASHAHMSERTFLRRFRDEVGAAPMAWLQRERIFRAQEMLEASNASLGDIAAQCGYASLETFRVAFRRLVGTSPAAYRNRFSRRPDQYFRTSVSI